MASAKPRPSTACAVIPVRDGVLASGGAEAVAEATQLGGRAILIGSGVADAVEDLSTLGLVELAEVGDFAPAAWATALAPMLSKADVVILPASPDGRDLAPRLAAVMDRPLVAGAIGIAADRATITTFGGLVQREVITGGPFIATLEPGVRGVDPSDASLDVAELAIRISVDSSDAELVEVLPPDAATMDLSEAPRIVGGGAGLMAGDDVDVRARFDTLVAVGEALDASMGATRVVTDAGYVGHDRQIGTTGVAVDPVLYLAFAISGAVQHTAGLGHPEHVISVNTDPHCPMMAMADLAVVADATAVLDELAPRLALTEANADA
jgi:electron transfer flavoprotein alpha subunit